MRKLGFVFIACIFSLSSLSAAFGAEFSTNTGGRYSLKTVHPGHGYGVAGHTRLQNTNDLIALEPSSSTASSGSSSSGSSKGVATVNGAPLTAGAINNASTLQSLQSTTVPNDNDNDCDDRPLPKKCKHPKSDKD
jgi:hypothetical protein